MPLYPADPWALLGFVIAVAGTAVIAFRDWPKAFGLAVVILAVFGVQAVGGGSVAAWLGFHSGAFFDAGHWWRPLTYMYVHADVEHIFGNLFILVTAGPALEERVGARNFFIVFFLAGFAAVAAHPVLESLDVIATGDLVVGASGAIFGVLTTFAVRHPRDRLPIWLFFILWLPAFVVLLIHLAFNVALMLGPNVGIAWYAHFAGYLVGLVAAGVVKSPALPGPGELPDVDALRPLATDRDMEEMLDKAAQFTGEDKNDVEFAMSWVDRFVARAECPHHHVPLVREGRAVKCPRGDVEIRV